MKISQKQQVDVDFILFFLQQMQGEAGVGSVDCQKYRSFCQEQGVNSYPTIRLYPHYSQGSRTYVWVLSRFFYWNSCHLSFEFGSTQWFKIPFCEFSQGPSRLAGCRFSIQLGIQVPSFACNAAELSGIHGQCCRQWGSLDHRFLRPLVWPLHTICSPLRKSGKSEPVWKQLRLNIYIYEEHISSILFFHITL